MICHNHIISSPECKKFSDAFLKYRDDMMEVLTEVMEIIL